MSFLLNALGAAAGPLIERGASWLMNRAKPHLSRAFGFVNRVFGTPGDKTGKSASEYLIDKAVNGANFYADKLAKGEYFKRKMPIIANTITSAAEALRDRLRGEDLLTQNTSGPPGVEKMNTD